MTLPVEILHTNVTVPGALVHTAPDFPRLLPGAAGFEAAIAPFNRAIVHRPALVALPPTAPEVAAAVAHAAARAWPVTVQATGHGAVQAADGGLLVATQAMRGIAVDPVARTLRVEAGVVWRDAIAAAAAHGLAPVNGSATTVGAIGYLTGGGMGPLSRAFGFAADSVDWLDLVTPDGVLRRVDPEHEPELFWGVRGGKGNFGIVTAAQLRLYPVARLHGGGIWFPGEATAALLHAYREWVPTLPEEAHVSLALLRLPRTATHVDPALTGRLVCNLRVTWPGGARGAQTALAPLRAIARPLRDTVGELPYAQVGTIHNEPTDPLPRWGRGALLRELPEAAVDALVEAVGPQRETALAVAELRPMGGAVARQPEHPNAVAGRDAAFSLNLLGPLLPGREAEVPATGERLLVALAPWSTGGSLINFQGAATAPAQIAASWSPEAYARLQRLKAAVDPQHLFGTGHVIEPAQ